MMSLRLPIPFVLLCAALVAAVPNDAQAQRASRPYRGLFGGGSSVDVSESLTLSASTGGGWDTGSFAALAAEAPAPNEAVAPLRGASYSAMSGSLVYAHSDDRFSFGGSLASSGRYYPSYATPYFASHAGRIALDYRPSRSTTLTASEGVSYQPFGSLNLFPSLETSTLQAPATISVAAAPNVDLRALSGDYFSSSSEANLSQQLSARSSVSAGYTYTTSRFGTGAGNFESQMASGRYTRGITENLSVRLGYGRRQGRFAGVDGRFINHSIDSGLDYARAFSPSRRTTVGFDSGATIVSDGQTTRYDVIGNARVMREIGRSWALSGTYRRDVRYVETLNQPLFSDGLSVGIDGFASRRVQVNTGMGASSGNLGFEASANNLWSYFGTAGVTVGISRHLALAGAYSLYHYSLDGNTYRQLGLGSELQRHSVTVFLRAWAPILQKGRRSNASR